MLPKSPAEILIESKSKLGWATLDTEIVADAMAMSATWQADKRAFDAPQVSKSIVPAGCYEEHANAIYLWDTDDNPDPPIRAFIE